MANVYFFVIAVLCSIEAISPYSPVTAIAPLMFVVGVGVLREGIEDFYRWSSDKEQNSKVASVLSLDGGGGGAGGGEPRAGSPAFVDTPWRDIRVGDLVHVKDKQPIPADLMLLWSSAEDGVAYIDTVNLDGETNLKRRKAKDATAPLLVFGGGHLATAAAHAATCATLGCIAPDGDLYKVRRQSSSDGAAHTRSPPPFSFQLFGRRVAADDLTAPAPASTSSAASSSSRARSPTKRAASRCELFPLSPRASMAAARRPSYGPASRSRDARRHEGERRDSAETRSGLFVRPPTPPAPHPSAPPDVAS